MQIIIVGCGKVGRALAAQLSGEDNNVTVVDTNGDVVKTVANYYDVMGVTGNGASYSVLAEADIEHTDVLIAVTHNDEVNLLCCVVARKAANCHTIARVRNPVYSEERAFLRKELGLSMIINPEYAAAQEIARLLRFPSAIEIDSFSKGRIEMLRFRVPAASMLDGLALRELPQKLPMDVLICAAERGEEVLIPDGNFVIRSGDLLSMIAIPGNAAAFFKKVGISTNQVKNTMIIGGGEITYYLSKLLLNMGIRVKIIEKRRERCEELSDLLPKATIICGDGSDRELLREEHLEQMDSLVAGTDMDEENIILSLYARDRVRAKVVTKLNHLDFNDVIHSLDLDSLIYPKNIAAEYILQYVRAIGNSMGSNVETLYKLMDGRVEALEFLVHKNSDLAGIRLQDMRLKRNLLIAGIGRKGRLIIPGGQDEFLPGDSVIVVTTDSGFQDIHDILDTREG
ncbi:MAG TPA: Trk system potassium transporter TrkA [Candidatus Scatomonas merdigallinarum]|nr:Trk system potassium transporter TrkA [Candidatus Scatomonas merdigallinarum]